jgi:hypothetical protein
MIYIDLGLSSGLRFLYIVEYHFLIPPFVLLKLNTTSLHIKPLISKSLSTINYINTELIRLKHDFQDYIDAIRTGSQNPESLHRANQKQHARSKPGSRRGIERVLREARR